MQSSLPKYISILLLVLSSACFAGEKNYSLALGLHEGGDEIPTKEFAPNHISKLHSGEFFSIALGINLHINNRLYITPSIGSKYNTNSIYFIRNDTTIWQVYMLDIPIAYRTDDWQLSAGLTYHYKPTLTLQSDKYREDWRFENSIGTIIGFDYYYSKDTSLGLHYTKIDYTMPGIKPVTGDNVSLIWRILFSI